MTPEETVWDRICLYNASTSRELLKRNTSAEILAVLTTYPHKDKYHGHGSGGRGDGENLGASDNRKKAIAHIRANIRPSKMVEPRETKTAPKKEIMKQNQATTRSLIAAVDSATNYGAPLHAALDAIDSGWRSNRSVQQHIEIKKQAKKALHRNKAGRR